MNIRTLHSLWIRAALAWLLAGHVRAVPTDEPAMLAAAGRIVSQYKTVFSAPPGGVPSRDLSLIHI